MVTHGRSKEGDALHPRDEVAGQKPSDVMKERGLLPLPAAPPSGDAWEYRNAVREGEEAPKWKRMQENSSWVLICTAAGR
jgi:hypothetical protein